MTLFAKQIAFAMDVNRFVPTGELWYDSNKIVKKVSLSPLGKAPGGFFVVAGHRLTRATIREDYWQRSRHEPAACLCGHADKRTAAAKNKINAHQRSIFRRRPLPQAALRLASPPPCRGGGG